MQKWLITFMSSGSMYVEAENEEGAKRKFESRANQEAAASQLAQNGVDLTDCQEYEE